MLVLWGSISGLGCGTGETRFAERLLLLDVICEVTQRLELISLAVTSLEDRMLHTDSPARRSLAVCGPSLYRSALVDIFTVMRSSDRSSISSVFE